MLKFSTPSGPDDAAVPVRLGACALLLLLALPGAASADAGRAVRLNTQEWPPYQTEVGGEPRGLAVAAVTCVFARLGRDVEVRFLPWRRAQEEVVAGTADGYFAASASADRDVHAVLSAPIAPQTWTWYFLPATTLRPGEAAFPQQARVTATRGSNMAHWLRGRGYRLESEPRTPAQLVEMLVAGRVDAVLANPLSFAAAIHDTAVGTTRFASRVERDQPLGVYFSRRFLAAEAGFMAAFNREVPACAVRP